MIDLDWFVDFIWQKVYLLMILLLEYNYLCNQCLSPLLLWFCILLLVRCTWYNIMWWSLSETCCRFSLGTLVSSTNKTNHHDITEILFKVALNTITLASLFNPSITAWNLLSDNFILHYKQYSYTKYLIPFLVLSRSK